MTTFQRLVLRALLVLINGIYGRDAAWHRAQMAEDLAADIAKMLDE